MRVVWIMLLCGLAAVWAQDIAVQYFQEIEDIKNAYYNNEITEEQYYELLQLYEDKVEVNTGNLRRLLSIPGVTREDVQALERARLDRGPFRDMGDVRRAFPGDFNLIEPFITVVPPIKKHFTGYFKIYTSRDYASPPDRDDPSYSTKLYLRSGRWSADIRHRQKGEYMGQLTYRSIQYNGKHFDLAIGNYYRKEQGFGLLVGRYLSLPSYEKDVEKGTNYLLSPYYGDLNGIYFRWEIGPHWSVSSELSTNYYKDNSYQHLISGSVGYYKRRMGRVGVVFYQGRLVDFKDDGVADFSQYGASVFGEYFLKNRWKLRNETAVLDNGAWGTNLIVYSPRRDRVSIQWKFWAYHSGFHALYSDGECDRDYETYYPPGFSFYLKDYRAGEMGGYMSTRFPLGGDFRGEIRGIYYNVPNKGSHGGEGYISVKYSAGRRGYATLYIDRQIDHDYNGTDTKDKINLSIRWSPTAKISTKFYTYFRWGDYDNSTYWRNSYRVSASAYYRVRRKGEIGVRIERYDSDVDDPNIGYYTFLPSVRFNLGGIDWRTELSFRKYDDEDGISLVARVNAMTSF